MTAVPDWDLVDPRNTDAELVSGSIAGDRAAFAQIYDRYADRLHDFCVGMLRDRDGAADCVQDTFCIAAARLPQLKDPDKLRPWLYSIARNEALRRLRERRRETPSDELPDVESEDDGPDTVAARTELADLIAEAAGGLTDRDRAVFDLAFRHGLNGPDLADALGVSHSNANTMVQRLKGTIERSLGALLVARRSRSRPGECAELDEILANWDGHFTVLIRKRVSRHVESCPTCDDERRRLVSPAALLGAAPALIPAPAWLRERTLGEVELTSHGSAFKEEFGDVSADASGTARRRKLVLAAVLLLALLGVSAGLTWVWLNKESVSIAPADITEKSPQPAGQTPAPAEPAPPSVVVPPPPSVQPPAVPQNTAPASPPPVDEQTAAPEPATEAPPPTEAPQPKLAPPVQKPPMSFSPTVVAPGPAAPTPGGNGGPGRSPTGGP
jgi:RNA polymerase sigma factor (sigma-70 family)